jgi:branched-subunit amino acid aminotransferase/4-amino-4-deoxychorismate lyase
LSAGALYGITRGVVMELARQNGMAVSEPNLTRYDFSTRTSAF